MAGENRSCPASVPDERISRNPGILFKKWVVGSNPAQREVKREGHGFESCAGNLFYEAPS